MIADLFFLAELAALVQYSTFFFKCRKRNCELVQPVQLKRTGLLSRLHLGPIAPKLF